MQKRIQCLQTGKIFRDISNKSGILTKHLRTLDISTTNVFEHFKIIEIEDDNRKYIECPITGKRFYDEDNKSGQFTLYILNKLQYSCITSFCDDFPEYKKYFDRLLYKESILFDKNLQVRCLICNQLYRKITRSHLEFHGISMQEYKEKYSCKIVSKSTSSKQSVATLKRNFLYGSSTKNHRSKLEDDFKNKLILSNISFEQQYLLNGKRYDFYIPELQYLIEINGEAFHVDSIENISSFTQLNTFLNDIKKIEIAQDNRISLFQIRYNVDLEFQNIDELLILLNTTNYEIDLCINEDTKILSKEYLLRFQEYKGYDKLEKYVRLLCKFIYEFCPSIIEFKRNTSLSRFIPEITLPKNLTDNKCFYYNKYNSSGSSYLRTIFLSYYQSRYETSETLELAWKDEDLIRKIIKYRIGLNKGKECWDFSIHNIIKGYQVNRYLISWFKPSLAAGIYKELLQNKDNSVVFDACAGFGARMLGFYSQYPNGTYIAVEPSKSTYNELCKLSKILDKPQTILINDYVENVENLPEYDLAFTSIPYWNKEVYNNDKVYKNFEEWKNIFLNKIKSLKNCYINIPDFLYKEFPIILDEYKLIHNTSNFNKSTGNKKHEWILKIS